MPPREGGGGYSHNGPNGKAPPERGTFSTFFFSHTTFIKPTRVCDRVDRPTQNPLQSYGVGLTTGILIWKGTAYNNPQGGTMPEWGSFIRLQGIWKGRELSDFSTYRGPKVLRMHFMLKKSKENVLVLWFIYSLKIMRSQQLKGMQSSKIGMWEKYHFSTESIRKK